MFASWQPNLYFLSVTDNYPAEQCVVEFYKTVVAGFYSDIFQSNKNDANERCEIIYELKSFFDKEAQKSINEHDCKAPLLRYVILIFNIEYDFFIKNECGDQPA